MKKILIGIIVLVLGGCATPAMKMARNNDALLSLEMGMTKQQVIDVMGKPNLNEAYQSLHDKSVAIFFYYTQRKWSDGNITKDETTPVVFENGKLVGWGSEFYKNKIEVDVNVTRNQ